MLVHSLWLLLLLGASASASLANQAVLMDSDSCLSAGDNTGNSSYDLCCPDGKTGGAEFVGGSGFQFHCNSYAWPAYGAFRRASSAHECAMLCAQNDTCTAATWTVTEACFFTRAENFTKFLNDEHLEGSILLEKIATKEEPPDDEYVEWEPVQDGPALANISNTTVAFSPDSKWLAYHDKRMEIVIWDLENRRPAHRIPLYIGSADPPQIVWSSDMKKLAVWLISNLDTTIRVVDIESENVRYIHGTSSPFRLVFLPYNKRFVTSSFDDTLRVWDVETGENTIKSKTQWDAPLGLSLSPDNGTLAVGHKHGQIRIYNTTSWQILDTLDNVRDVYALAFSPDGKHLTAVKGIPSEIQIWNMATRNVIRKLEGAHTKPCWHLAYSADGKQLASASARWDQQFIYLWNLFPNPPTKAVLVGPVSLTNDVGFSADGKYLAASFWESGSPTSRITLLRARRYVPGNHSTERFEL